MPIIARAVGSTWFGCIPAGQPFGGAVLFEPSVSDQLDALMSAAQAGLMCKTHISVAARTQKNFIVLRLFPLQNSTSASLRAS